MVTRACIISLEVQADLVVVDDGFGKYDFRV